MNIPNAISLFRLCSVPLLVWLLLKHHFEWALWVVCRCRHQRRGRRDHRKTLQFTNHLGKLFRPTRGQSAVGFRIHYWRHYWAGPHLLVLLVVFRDLVIVGGAVVFETVTKSLEMKPLLISKVNTLAQIVLVISALSHAVYTQPGNDIVGLLQYAVAFTTSRPALRISLYGRSARINWNIKTRSTVTDENPKAGLSRNSASCLGSRLSLLRAF